MAKKKKKKGQNIAMSRTEGTQRVLDKVVVIPNQGLGGGAL